MHGIASHWRLQGKLAFRVDEANAFMQHLVTTYPGPVQRVLVQLPMPHRLDTTTADHSQLPVSATEGHMDTTSLLKQVARLDCELIARVCGCRAVAEEVSLLATGVIDSNLTQRTRNCNASGVGSSNFAPERKD